MPQVFNVHVGLALRLIFPRHKKAAVFFMRRYTDTTEHAPDEWSHGGYAHGFRPRYWAQQDNAHHDNG